MFCQRWLGLPEGEGGEELIISSFLPSESFLLKADGVNFWRPRDSLELTSGEFSE
jgi:hypothetical protein